MTLTRKKRFTTESAGRAMLAEPKTSSAPPRSIEKRCEITHTTVGGFEVYVVRPRGHASEPRSTPRAAVVYLHGGAYVAEIVKDHWAFIADIAEQVGCEVHVPIYGLAPEHTGLEARDFVMEVLAGLAADGRPAYLMGDSAGAGLSLIAAQAAASHPDIRVLGVTLIAPWLDMTMSNPEVEAMEHDDPWLARPGLRPMADAWAAGTPLDDPRLSPIYGDLTDLPPVEIWVGTRDITWPDCRALRDKLPKASLGGYHELSGAIHVPPLLPVPEGRASRRAIIERLRVALAPTEVGRSTEAAG